MNCPRHHEKEIENPYSPFDPHWHIVEAYLRKKKEAELNKEIVKLFIIS